MGHLIGPAILANNRVGALINGDQIFPAMLESIRPGNRSIWKPTSTGGRRRSKVC
jgi:cardiolipin synthase